MANNRETKYRRVRLYEPHQKIKIGSYFRATLVSGLMLYNAYGPVLVKLAILTRFKKTVYEPKKINSVTKSISQVIWKVSSKVQSITSNSLTVLSMQQSKMKRHMINHQRSKRSLFIFRPTYILKLKTNLYRWQMTLALMSTLQVHGAIERRQSIRAAILQPQQIIK